MQTLELAQKYQMEEVLPEAAELKITTQAEYSQVNDFLVGYKKLRKKIVDYFEPIVSAAYKAHQQAKKLENQELLVIDNALKIIVPMLQTWRDKQETERLAEQAHQNSEIKRMAEKEKAELLAKAVELEAAGATIEAACALEAATQVKAPEYTLAITTEKTERTASGTTSWIPEWEVEVMDPMAVILAICGGLLPPDCIEVRDGRVKAWAKAYNLASGEYHGCRIKRTERPSVR